MAESKAGKVLPTKNDDWGCLNMASNELSWNERTPMEKVRYVTIITGKVVLVPLLVYLFIISLGLMGSAFKILGGKTAGHTFRNQDLFDNPFAGLVIGILATVLVQSSSTSTSIIITMTAAGLIEVQNAVFMIMGANIGTSVTNTIVSLASIGNKDQYRRAFAGATVHDCFNCLTVLVLLPVEAATGMLKAIAVGLVSASIDENTERGGKQDFLKLITKPVTSRLVQVDKKLSTAIAEATDPVELAELEAKSMIVNKRTKDNHLFMDTPLSDSAAGVLLLVASLVLLSVILILLVKLLQSIFTGRVALWFQAALNLEFKRIPFLADYLLVLFGVGITILMQSSSITTSTLTPLVGIGLIRLEKMLPFTVGANIGTTVTGVLAALASSNIAIGLQVAICHVLFNFVGTLIWFPIPFLRAIPLNMAKFLGSLAADLTWFPIAYLVVVFAVMPLLVLGLSLGGPIVLGLVGGPLLLGLVAIIAILVLRKTRPSVLPRVLREDRCGSFVMPQSLRIADENDAEDASAVRQAAAGSADLTAGNWWQGPIAWGCGWLTVLMLLISLPNCQWANVKHANLDGREHVGFGAWSVCSKMYKEDGAWAPVASCTTAAEAASCAAMSGCGNATFSEDLGRDSDYVDAWKNCKATCTTAAWEAACLAQSCGGALHREQCTNVSQAVSWQQYTSTHGPSGGMAWLAGEACRPLSEVCDNSGPMGHVGNLGVVGALTNGLGEALLLAYVFLRQKRDAKALCYASLAAFGLSWVLLLSSWASFAGVLAAETTCVVMHGAPAGAVSATGAFSEIVDPSYTYGFVVGSWLLTTAVLAVVGHHCFELWSGGAKRDSQVAFASASPDASTKASTSDGVPAASPPLDAPASSPGDGTNM